MKKLFMTLVKIVLAISLMIGFFIEMFLLSSYFSKINLKNKQQKKSIICDQNPYVTEQPEFWLINFEDKDLDKIKFQILRDKQLIKDTILLGTKNQEYNTSIRIPYKEFLKTDTIVVSIDTLNYSISDFHHGADLLYGIFGPVTVSDCFLFERFTINNQKNTKILNKNGKYIN